MKVSIIIPVLNEEQTIGKLLEHLIANSTAANIAEIIVVDGGSTDNTCETARNYAVTLLECDRRGRALQMNHGAGHATGSIYYFLHADSFPPPDFDRLILKNVGDGYPSGCFRLKFDSSHLVLRFFAWFTRFNFSICRGGDQSLFVQSQLFRSLNGFNEELRIMEDMDFIRRVRSELPFVVIPAMITTSARRYMENGVIKLQLLFGLLHIMDLLGFSHNARLFIYKKYIM